MSETTAKHCTCTSKEEALDVQTAAAKKPEYSNSSENNTKSPLKPYVSPQRTTSTRQLIIDGCNGPIRLLDPSKCKGDSRKALSFLRVINGESQKVRIDVVPKIDALLAKEIFGNVRILFDGGGIKDKAGKKWTVSSRVSVEISGIGEEVDGIIVKELSKQQFVRVDRTVGSYDLREISQSFGENTGNDYSSDGVVYCLRRTSKGPGRSRTVLKQFQLLRPGSLYCIFGFAAALCSSAVKDAKRLKGVRGLIKVYREEVNESMAVVVTDDVLLRQRVVDTGAFVMTFEQLWDLLVAQE
eukprot:CAMPEP_0194276454 /NCGR_PEP_ID=MMETSP0169-20130528/9054_1 /TAXON_ID=218684 /ORGANISM="Corethron pennatum, Strain L29A3" /LENGTH=297 /DNA_ID=CAMNT_0039020187 /DNA_START=120 /DNA_END=1013 /DNA_ORIENTATION=+